jgi:hypothetical protein
VKGNTPHRGDNVRRTSLSPEMAPAAPSVIHITGKVKGAPKIKTEGNKLVVSKTLHPNAVVEERHPRRRVTGKKKDTQLIPAIDVARAIDGERAEAKTQVTAINRLANLYTDRLSDELEAVKKTSAGYAEYIANHINHPPPPVPSPNAGRRRRRVMDSPEGAASASMQFDVGSHVDRFEREMAGI